MFSCNLAQMISTYFSYFFSWTVGKLEISHVTQTWAKFNFLGQRAESNSTIPVQPSNCS